MEQTIDSLYQNGLLADAAYVDWQKSPEEIIDNDWQF